jgi:hypothetical protein
MPLRFTRDLLISIPLLAVGCGTPATPLSSTGSAIGSGTTSGTTAGTGSGTSGSAGSATSGQSACYVAGGSNGTGQDPGALACQNLGACGNEPSSFYTSCHQGICAECSLVDTTLLFNLGYRSCSTLLAYFLDAGGGSSVSCIQAVAQQVGLALDGG